MIKAALVIQESIAGKYDLNLACCLDFISKAADNDAKIIVFPEMNLTGYVAGPGIKEICRPITKEMTNLFCDLAKTHDMDIWVGLAEQAKDKKIYASHLIFHPDATPTLYRKIHTAPNEKKYFTAGDNIVTFTSFGFNFGIQLCYDAHFPELSLAMALKKTDVIFIPHASPRGTSQEKYNSWMRHLTARAFDNGIYIAACNQTGDNKMGLNFPGLCLLIGPDGNIIYSSKENSSQGLHMITLKKSVLNHVRTHKMRYFIPNRRNDLFKF